MPSKSAKQARLMAAAAHDPEFAKKVGIPVSVAKEFNKADAKTGILRKRKKMWHHGQGTIFMRATRPSWDQTFLDLATVIACRSKDPSSQVGAVISDMNRRVVSLGYNGYPRGIEDTADTDPREIKLWKTIHAEENALLFAGRSLDLCTLYVTHHPCPACAAKIVQVGIRRVVYLRQLEFEKRWAEQLDIARQIFVQAGVLIEGVLP